MEQIKDSASNPILSWSSQTAIGSMIAGSTSLFPFDLRGQRYKVWTVKNVGTTALIAGSLLTSHDGTLWQVADGTSWTTLAAAAMVTAKVEDARRYWQFSGSVATTNVINVFVSASSF